MPRVRRRTVLMPYPQRHNCVGASGINPALLGDAAGIEVEQAILPEEFRGILKYSTAAKQNQNLANV
jgi:hypothetical protein